MVIAIILYAKRIKRIVLPLSLFSSVKTVLNSTHPLLFSEVCVSLFIAPSFARLSARLLLFSRILQKTEKTRALYSRRERPLMLCAIADFLAVI
jgi:hypothetical protein